MGVRSYLATQVQEVRAGDAALRAGGPEAVHDARVAVRRVRSVLRVFPTIPADGLESPLRRWSDRLGEAREAAVLAETFAQACPGTLLDELAPDLQTERTATSAVLLAELDSAEHRWLIEALTALPLREPEQRLHAHKSAKRAARKARRRLAAAGSDPELLHAARKAAKRARYAAEAVGDSARAERWEAVQDALGEHHDCVVALQWLDDVPGDDAARARQALRERAAAALAECGDGTG